MGGGGQSVPDSQTQIVEPWSEQKGALETVMGLTAGITGVPTAGLTGNQQQAASQAGNFATAPQAIKFYPGQTYAGFSGETEQALQGQAQRARMGSPVDTMAQAQNLATTSGQYLGAGNPYFQNMVNRTLEGVTPTIQSQFAQSGRSDSGLANRALGQGIGDAVGQLAYQNYGDERSRQMQAMGQAPQLSELDYRDAAALAEVGQAREALSQQGINEDIERFNFAQTEPYQRLALFNQAVQGNMGSTSIGTQTSSSNSGSRLGNVLGGAAGAGGLLALMASGQ